MHPNAGQHSAMTIPADSETHKIESIKCGNLKCNVKFVPKRKWQKFCSPGCRVKGYWQEHEVVKRGGA